MEEDDDPVHMPKQCSQKLLPNESAFALTQNLTGSINGQAHMPASRLWVSNLFDQSSRASSRGAFVKRLST